MADSKEWSEARFTIYDDENETFEISVSGRDRWALEALVAAGIVGCTPIDTPGPRWSAYVFNLRKMGVRIETIREQHTGPFAGSHARYVLQSIVGYTQSGAEVAA